MLQKTSCVALKAQGFHLQGFGVGVGASGLGFDCRLPGGAAGVAVSLVLAVQMPAKLSPDARGWRVISASLSLSPQLSSPELRA